MRRTPVRPLHILALFTGALLTSCSGDQGPPPIASVTVSPGTLTLTFVGDTGTLTATVRDEQGGAPQVTITWRSSNPSVADVSADGVVTARNGGSASITASAGGVTSTPVSVTVDQQVSSVSVDPASLAFTALGETRDLSASASDQGGAPVTGTTFNWVTTNPAVASVSTSGRVTAEGNGSASIRANADGVNSANVSVSVQQVAVSASLTSDPAVQMASIGETAQITVEARDAMNRIIESPSGSYASSDPSVATVNGAGVITATGNGTAEISVAVDGVSADPVEVTVEQVAVSIQASPSLVVLQAPGDEAEVTAEAEDAMGNPVAGIAFTWTTADAAVATVDLNGATVTVTGTGAGTTDVTASSDGLQSNPVEAFVGGGGTTELVNGERIEGLEGPAGLQRFYKITVPQGAGELHIGTGGGTAFDGSPGGDLDLFARRGQLPTNDFNDPDQVASGNPENNEWIEILDPEPGDWFILVDGFVNPGTGTGPGYRDVALRVRVRDEAQGFNIGLAFVSNFTDNQRQLIAQARDRWESVLTQDLISFWLNFPAAPTPVCGIPGFELNDLIEDLVVLVAIGDFDDGQNGTLAAAAPCVWRVGAGQDLLTIVGLMVFDEPDLPGLEASGTLTETALHELGHVLGFGTQWGSTTPPLIQGAGTSDPTFVGPLATQAFDAAGGTGYSGAKVPVENVGGQGSVDSHWRESIFLNELMTSLLGSQVEPLSAITLNAFIDGGWPGVDLSQADAYQLPGSGGAGERAAQQETKGISLGKDILDVDGFAVDENGEVTLVRPGTERPPVLKP
jgi:hypothetical protein